MSTAGVSRPPEGEALPSDDVDPDATIPRADLIAMGVFAAPASEEDDLDITPITFSPADIVGGGDAAHARPADAPEFLPPPAMEDMRAAILEALRHPGAAKNDPAPAEAPASPSDDHPSGVAEDDVDVLDEDVVDGDGDLNEDDDDDATMLRSDVHAIVATVTDLPAAVATDAEAVGFVDVADVADVADVVTDAPAAAPEVAPDDGEQPRRMEIPVIAFDRTIAPDVPRERWMSRNRRLVIAALIVVVLVVLAVLGGLVMTGQISLPGTTTATDVANVSDAIFPGSCCDA